MTRQELPLNRKSRTILAHAQREAGRLLHPAVEPAHVLLGILRQGDCFAADLIRDTAPNLDTLKADIEAFLGFGSIDNVTLDIPLSESTQTYLSQTDAIRRQLRHEEIRSDHLLLGLTHDSAGPLAAILEHHGITTKRVLEAILAEFGVVQQATPMEILILQSLAKRGELTSQVLESLLGRKEGQGVKDALLSGGHIREEDIVGLVAREYGCQSLDFNEFKPDAQLIGQFPPELARRLAVFPVRFDSDEDTLYVALADPFESQKVEEIQGLWGVNVVPLLAGEGALRQLLDKYFPQA